MSFKHSDAVAAHSKTKGIERLILWRIASRCNPNNESCPGMALLAKEANCTKRSVINALKKIPKDELQIISRGQGKGNSNRYRLLLPVESEKVKSTTEKVKSDSPEPEGTIIKETPIVPKGDKSQKNENLDFKNPALLRILKLFQIPENQPMDSTIRRAWQKNRKVVENLSQEEWELLEWAYSQTDGEAFDFRRQSPGKLIRNLRIEITRARSWKGKPQDETPRQRPAPDGWAEMILAEYPDAQLTTWEFLADSMKAWVREKVRESASLPLHHAFVADSAMP